MKLVKTLIVVAVAACAMNANAVTFSQAAAVLLGFSAILVADAPHIKAAKV